MTFERFISLLREKAGKEAHTCRECFGAFAEIRQRCLGAEAPRDLLERLADGFHFRSGSIDELQINISDPFYGEENDLFRIGLALSYDGYPNASANKGDKKPPVWVRLDKAKNIFPGDGLKTIWHNEEAIEITDGFRELKPEDGGFQLWGRLVEWKEKQPPSFYNNLVSDMLSYLNKLMKIYRFVYCNDN